MGYSLNKLREVKNMVDIKIELGLGAIALIILTVCIATGQFVAAIAPLAVVIILLILECIRRLNIYSIIPIIIFIVVFIVYVLWAI